MSLSIRYVIHKSSRLPSPSSYDGVVWDQARLRSDYKPSYSNYYKALDLANKLTKFSAGAGVFTVSEKPRGERE